MKQYNNKTSSFMSLTTTPDAMSLATHELITRNQIHNKKIFNDSET